jgi:hypothetical protein
LPLLSNTLLLPEAAEAALMAVVEVVLVVIALLPVLLSRRVRLSLLL